MDTSLPQKLAALTTSLASSPRDWWPFLVHLPLWGRSPSEIGLPWFSFGAIRYHLKHRIGRDLVPSRGYGLITQPVQSGFGIWRQINGKVAIGFWRRFRNRRERYYVTRIVSRPPAADSEDSVWPCERVPHRIVQHVIHRTPFARFPARSTASLRP